MIKTNSGLKINKRKYQDNSIKESIYMYESANVVARRMAYWSHLGWVFDLAPRLEKLTKSFSENSPSSMHRYLIASEIEPTPRFEITSIPQYFLPPPPGTKNSSKLFEQEDSAALVYSFHVSGMVTVSIHPHKSGWGSFGADKNYVIGLYQSTTELAGMAGDHAIIKHINTFLKLTSLSLACHQPSRSSQKFLKHLETKSDKYKNTFPSRDEQKRATLNAELGLAAGLGGGLIASTIIPFAQKFGEEKEISATERIKFCNTSFKANPARIANCVEDSNYKLDRIVSGGLSTGSLLIIALILTLGCFIGIKNRLNKR